MSRYIFMWKNIAAIIFKGFALYNKVLIVYKSRAKLYSLVSLPFGCSAEGISVANFPFFSRRKGKISAVPKINPKIRATLWQRVVHPKLTMYVVSTL